MILALTLARGKQKIQVRIKLTLKRDFIGAWVKNFLFKSLVLKD